MATKKSKNTESPKMPETITFHLQSWLENAGIVGLYRILGKENVTVNDQSITIPVSALDNFAEKYFQFFASKRHYGKLTRYQNILDFEDTLEEWQEDDFEEFDDSKLSFLSNWFKNTLKYAVNSNSYKKLYEIIGSNLDVVEAVKSADSLLKQLNKKNFLKKNPEEAHEILINLSREVLQIIEYFRREDSKKYFPAKTLCYTVINNAWNGVSFLNPQAKEIDFYNDYQEYFVEPIKKYLANSHEKDKFVCSTCGRPIKQQKLSYSFLTGMGYDTARKTSNAWNFNNDQFMCPICQLLYSCVSAGFNYNLSKEGIFINYNYSVDDLIDANDSVKETIFRSMNGNAGVSPFRAFTTSIANQINEKKVYDLADIQVVTYDDDHYGFTVIPPLASHVIKKSLDQNAGKDIDKNLLSSLYNTGIRNFRGFSYYSIYDEVMRRLFSSTNLFSLIYEMELLLNSQSTDVRFNTFHVMTLIYINHIFMEELQRQGGEKVMEEGKESLNETEVTRETLSKMRGAGRNVLKYYNDNENVKKASALAYKLLQAIHSNSPERFMTTLLAVYASQSKLVPKNLVNNINHPEVFKQYALAFVAGLIGSDEKGEVKNDAAN